MTSRVSKIAKAITDFLDKRISKAKAEKIASRVMGGRWSLEKIKDKWMFLEVKYEG